MNSRRQAILEQLRGGREIAVQQLARQYGVSPITIRRDLDALALEGPITRTHGGAMLSRTGVVEFSFLQRTQEQVERKRAIARYIAGIVQPGTTVVLDTGTTTLEVARALAGIANLRVLTSSLAIAAALHAQEHLELVLLGGCVRHTSPDLSGPLTEENLRQFRPDMAILGADALDREGAYTCDLGVAGISRAMIACARESWLVVDSTKFARQAFVRFATWDRIGHLVTDEGVSKKDRKWAAKAVSTLHLAAIP